MLRLSTFVLSVGIITVQSTAFAQWQGSAANAQHTAQATAPIQNLARIHWKTQIDLHPQLSGGELLIHYGTPIITAANTLILPVKTGATDDFRVDARNVATRALIWSASSDYRLPPHDWTPIFGPQLTVQNRLYFAGAGGTVFYRDTPDVKGAQTHRLAFYGVKAFVADKAVYSAAVQIDTPLTSDSAGNIYFGFTVNGTTPLSLVSGIARVGADGTGEWVAAAAAASDSSIVKVQTNAAPAISNDQKTVYVVVSTGSTGYLLGLDTATLHTKYKVKLKDPVSGDDSWINDDSSAAPTVGPDGDIFMGVLEAPFPEHNDRGWLLHYDATLTQQKITGSFGWDDTASIVPAAAVPSYTGGSAYLLFTKYNNYIDTGTGDGHNLIAILDPNASQTDLYSSTPVNVMREVITAAGPTPFPGGVSGQTYEWCINSGAVDVPSKSVVANSEDGHSYRWDLALNTISQGLLLNAPRPEAYTPTLIGVDGTIYAINNATLYAIGN